jgi:hypothetical protein
LQRMVDDWLCGAAKDKGWEDGTPDRAPLWADGKPKVSRKVSGQLADANGLPWLMHQQIPRSQRTKSHPTAVVQH